MRKPFVESTTSLKRLQNRKFQFLNKFTRPVDIKFKNKLKSGAVKRVESDNLLQRLFERLDRKKIEKNKKKWISNYSPFNQLNQRFKTNINHKSEKSLAYSHSLIEKPGSKLSKNKPNSRRSLSQFSFNLNKPQNFYDTSNGVINLYKKPKLASPSKLKQKTNKIIENIYSKLSFNQGNLR